MSAEILAALKRIEAKLDAALAKRQQAERSAPAPPRSAAVASATELDSQYGNPTVKFNPRDWSGDSCKGRSYADCPADFLDTLASTLEYFADKNAADDPKKAGYERKDAARARGWAARVRDGWKPEPAQQKSYDFDGDADEKNNDEIPF